jgi:dienelactone hydrolase
MVVAMIVRPASFRYHFTMKEFCKMAARWAVFACLAAGLMFAAHPAIAQLKPGDIKGTTLDPTPDNLAATFAKANLVLPASLTRGERWQGLASVAPEVTGKAPLVILLHGSSGIAPAVKDFQVWLADTLGLASVAPDSLAIEGRLTYTSPVAVDIYERVHALRLAELDYALNATKAWAWVDRARIVLAGTSEGSVAVSRYAGTESAARLIYSWSCEANYFVDRPRPGFGPTEPVFSAISARDPYFSPANAWNKDYAVTGTCAAALKDNPNAVNFVVDADVHTILNRADVREATAAFLRRALKP